VFPFT